MKTTVKELIHLSSNVFCTFNLTFFTVNTLRDVSGSFVKQGTPVPSSTIPAYPDSHKSLLTKFFGSQIHRKSLRFHVAAIIQ